MSEEQEQSEVVEDVTSAPITEEVAKPEAKAPKKSKPAAKKVAKSRVTKVDKEKTPEPEEPKPVPVVEDLFSVVNKYARSQKEAQKAVNAVRSGKSAAVNAQGRIVVDNHPFNKNGELFLRRNYGPITVILNLLETAKTDHIV